MRELASSYLPSLQLFPENVGGVLKAVHLGVHGNLLTSI